MEKILTHKLDITKIAEGMGLSIKDTIDFFNDGRIIGRYGEFIDSAYDGGNRMNENSSFDVEKENKLRREIRSAIKKISFASSKEVGYGRKVTEKGFQEKLDNVDDFGIIDTRQLVEKGELTIYSLSKDDVTKLNLGKNKSMSANKFWKIIDSWK